MADDKPIRVREIIGGLAGITLGVFCGIEAGDVVMESIRNLATAPVNSQAFNLVDTYISYATYITTIGFGAIGGAYIGNRISTHFISHKANENGEVKQ